MTCVIGFVGMRRTAAAIYRADLVRTVGLDQNHSAVTDDYSAVNHVALIVLIGMLDRPKKSEHPIVHLDGLWFMKRLRVRRDVKNQHSDQTEKGVHFDLLFGIGQPLLMVPLSRFGSERNCRLTPRLSRNRLKPIVRFR